MPHSRNDASLATEVGHALGQIHTWHLKGWKLQNGKPVPWDVWGCRQPALFWERVGNDATFDDGKTRIREFAPKAGIRPSSGVFLTFASVGNIAELVGNFNVGNISYRNMIDAHDWFRLGKPVNQSRGQALFHLPGTISIGDMREADDYTVDTHTALPILYEHKMTANRHTTVNEQLTAEYGGALPPCVTHSMPPPGYRNLDLSHISAEANLPTENTVSANGLTLQATPLGIDRQGNALVRLRVWLGNFRLLSSDFPNASQLFMGLIPTNVGAYADQVPLALDAQDRPYFYVLSTEKALGNGDVFCVFAPDRPLQAGSPRPHSLTISLTFQPAFGGSISYHATDATEDTRLFQQDLRLTVPLPDSPTKSGLTPLYPVSVREFQNELSLEALIASGRTGELYIKSTITHDPAKRHALLQEALASCQEAIRLKRPLYVEYGSDQLLLAQYYSRLGRIAEAKRVLKGIIAEGRKYPNWRGWRQQTTLSFVASDKRQDDARIKEFMLRNSLPGNIRRAEKYLKRVDKPETWD